MNDFNSLDRLLELGLSFGLAKQMINTVNTSIASMTIPGVDRPMTILQYYIIIDQTQYGPLNEAEMIVLIKDNKIDKNTLTWQIGTNGWVRAFENQGINKLLLLYTVPNENK